MTRSRPVTARASRRAVMVASVPELTKCTRRGPTHRSERMHRRVHAAGDEGLAEFEEFCRSLPVHAGQLGRCRSRKCHERMEAGAAWRQAHLKLNRTPLEVAARSVLGSPKQITFMARGGFGCV